MSWWWPGKRWKEVNRRLFLLSIQFETLQHNQEEFMATMATVKEQVAALEATVAKAVERLGQLADPAAFADLEARLAAANASLSAKVAETDPVPPPPPVVPVA